MLALQFGVARAQALRAFRGRLRLTAQGQRWRELILRACRRLAATGNIRFDLWPLVWFVLCDDTTVCWYDTDRQIAAEYVRAAARPHRETETAPDD